MEVGEEGDKLCTYRYTVTTRMTPDSEQTISTVRQKQEKVLNSTTALDRRHASNKDRDPNRNHLLRRGHASMHKGTLTPARFSVNT